MQIDECFRILDVPASASPDEIRNSYRTLVNVWHPDRFLGNEALRAEAERKLTLINQAFSTLEAAGFPQGDVQQAAAIPVASSDGGPAGPISRPVQTTIWGTSVVVLSFLFWLGLKDKPLTERLLTGVFAGFIAGSALSTMLFHVVWSVKTRPRTWIIMLGTSAVTVVWLSWVIAGRVALRKANV